MSVGSWIRGWLGRHKQESTIVGVPAALAWLFSQSKDLKAEIGFGYAAPGLLRERIEGLDSRFLELVRTGFASEPEYLRALSCLHFVKGALLRRLANKLSRKFCFAIIFDEVRQLAIDERALGRVYRLMFSGRGNGDRPTPPAGKPGPGEPLPIQFAQYCCAGKSASHVSIKREMRGVAAEHELMLLSFQPLTWLFALGAGCLARSYSNCIKSDRKRRGILDWDSADRFDGLTGLFFGDSDAQAAFRIGSYYDSCDEVMNNRVVPPWNSTEAYVCHLSHRARLTLRLFRTRCVLREIESLVLSRLYDHCVQDCCDGESADRLAFFGRARRNDHDRWRELSRSESALHAVFVDLREMTPSALGSQHYRLRSLPDGLAIDDVYSDDWAPVVRPSNGHRCASDLCLANDLN